MRHCYAIVLRGAFRGGGFKCEKLENQGQIANNLFFSRVRCNANQRRRKRLEFFLHDYKYDISAIHYYY
jgi:hypothetical protein